MPKILFFTNSEHGQASVILAVAHELMLRGDMDLHFMSFAPLDVHVQALSLAKGPEDTFNKSTATFHLLPGPSMAEAFPLHNEKKDWMHPPGAKGALDAFATASKLLVPWKDLEYIAFYKSCIDLIRLLEPDLIVMDPLFSPGIDACTAISKEFAVLSPNSFREILAGTEPLLTTLFKFPV
jgi:hypothetical protein